MQQYAVYAFDGSDSEALSRRMALREQHLAGVSELKASGNYVLGGAILNDNGQMIGSIMIVQFEAKEDLNAWLAREPYLLNGVWDKVEIHPYRVATFA